MLASGCARIVIPLDAPVEAGRVDSDHDVDSRPSDVANDAIRADVFAEVPADGFTDVAADATVDASFHTVPQIAAGRFHTCALQDTGAVLCLGANGVGQIGIGTRGWNELTPVRVTGIADGVEIAAGAFHTCVRRNAGTVVCWGSNAFGKIGNSTSDEAVPTPAQVTDLHDAVEIAGSFGNTCARRLSGAVMCWGSNLDGQIGDGTYGMASAERHAPVTVMGLTDAVEIATGDTHTCARRASGAVVCWGGNDQGQIGDGMVGGYRPIPVLVAGLNDAAGIAAGNAFTCARRLTGTVVCWGSNQFGTTGDGSNVRQTLTPVPIAGLTDAVQIEAGESHACARRVTGAVVCWGDNAFGQIGDGSIGGGTHVPHAVLNVADAVEISVGSYDACAREPTRIVCWGNDQSGQFGTGSVAAGRPVPVTVSGL